MYLIKSLFIHNLLAGLFLLCASSIHAEVIFSDSFDDQPDWNSGLHENDKEGLDLPYSPRGGWNVDIGQYADMHFIPHNWSFVRQTPVWAPSRGDDDRHENIEISLASTLENSNRTRGGTGKSFVTWRDSSNAQFASDGLLAKHFPDDPVWGPLYPEGFDQLYVEFYINFSDETIASYYDTKYPSAQLLSKLFRIYHWDGTGSNFDYYDNNINPNMIWGMEGRSAEAGGYGLRNSIALLTRRDRDSAAESAQRFIDSNGKYEKKTPSSYTLSARSPYGGLALKNKRDGGLYTSGFGDFDIIFGDETEWTKVAFFVKINSAPGVFDGQLIQWIDDRKSIELDTVNWVSASRKMVKWTTVVLGGNDNFRKYPNEERREEWYAIDDIKVATKIPDYLIAGSKSGSSPNSPKGVSVK